MEIYKHKDKRKLILYILMFIYALYGAYFIYSSSIVFGPTRYFVLFDDSMISMRYAKNLAAGQGLAWNPGGERVEGYTNLLWTLYMSIPHYLNIDASKTSLFIQISSLILLLFTLIYVYKITYFLSESNFAISIGAAVLAGTFFPNIFWALSGTEVGLLAFLSVLAAYYGIAMLKGGKFNIWFYIITGLMIFTRIDEVFLVIFLFLFMLKYDTKNRIMHLKAGLTSILTTVGILTLFRLYYYQDILPNTYYLKMTGYPLFLRMARGIWMFLKMILQEKLIPYIIPFLILYKNKSVPVFFTVYFFIVQSLYSVYIGGDAWDPSIGANRFIAQSMPVLFVSITIGAWRLINEYLKKVKPDRKILWYIASIAGLFFLLNTYNGTRTLKNIIFPNESKMTSSMRMLISARYIDEMTTKDAKIAVITAGTIPYFTDRFYIDELGKNDKYIARIPMRTPPANLDIISKINFFYPGHLKMDPDYSIKKLQPDVLWEVWGIDPEVIDYLSDQYYYICGIFVRKDTIKVSQEALDRFIANNPSKCR